MPPPQIESKGVFLNIPYDDEFRSLYVAYIVGLTNLGLVPHIASEIPGGTRRLDRVLALIKSCRYSIHDLSRVELSASPQGTPRFNMPLDLGMTITWADLYANRHTFFVFESERYRIQRSTSDLNGTDAAIHQGRAGRRAQRASQRLLARRRAYGAENAGSPWVGRDWPARDPRHECNEQPVCAKRVPGTLLIIRQAFCTL